MPETKRIVIAEGHTILRQCLNMLISSNSEFEVVGEAENGLEAIRSVKSQMPDFIIIDLSMPILDGVSAIQEIKKLNPSIKILVLTAHNDEDHILSAFKSGADGYILKDATYNELMLAIESIFSGRRYLSPGISEKVIGGYLEGKESVKSSTSVDTLSKREREVLKMIAENHRNKDIAHCLGISLSTVEKHRSNLMKKLNLHSASSLIAFAVKKGLITK